MSPRISRIALAVLVIVSFAAARVEAQCPPAQWVAGAGVPGTTDAINALVVLPGGDVVAGGAFINAGGHQVNYIARYNPTTGAWSAMGSGVTGTVYALAVLPGGDVIVGGSFTSGGGTPASNVARYNPTTGAWTALGAGTNGIVRAIAVLPGGDLVVVGNFVMAGGITVNFTARYTFATSAWSALGVGTGRPCFAATVIPGGDVIVGGTFTNAGPILTAGIARCNPATGAWSALGAGMGSNATVWALATLPGGDVVAGGTFNAGLGGPANNIARYSPMAGTWSAMNGGSIGTVYALGVPLAGSTAGEVVVGGDFTNAGGVSNARYIALCNPATLGWSALGTGTIAQVSAIAPLPGGDVAVGGMFTVAGGSTANFFARYAFGGESPTITAQPSNGVTCGVGPVAFSVAATGIGALGYQWQIETSPGVWQALASDPGPLPCGGGAFAYAAPVNAASVSIGVNPCAGVTSYQVRCVVSDPCGATTSNEATYLISSADFNGDGDVGTDGDIEAFFSCLAGNCCPSCGSVDFNGDGDVGTDADIESFFRVLAGGSC